MSDRIHKGDAVVLAITFFGRNGQAGDPATVTLRVRKPDGTVDGYNTFTHVNGTGLYERTILATQHGTWHGTWEGVGGVLTQESEPFTFQVESLVA